VTLIGLPTDGTRTRVSGTTHDEPISVRTIPLGCPVSREITQIHSERSRQSNAPLGPAYIIYITTTPSKRKSLIETN